MTERRLQAAKIASPPLRSAVQAVRIAVFRSKVESSGHFPAVNPKLVDRVRALIARRLQIVLAMSAHESVAPVERRLEDEDGARVVANVVRASGLLDAHVRVVVGVPARPRRPRDSAVRVQALNVLRVGRIEPPAHADVGGEGEQRPSRVQP